MWKLPTKIILPARYENLEKICNFVDAIARKAGFGESALYSIQTAVDEACANIIDHAYEGEGKGTIECSCKVAETKIEIVLHDHGRSFNPDIISDPDIATLIDDPKGRGLGLYFMRKLMDEVHFSFSEKSGNTLIMVKLKNKQS
jgi:serine/threonine-protein kinase RsbW